MPAKKVLQYKCSRCPRVWYVDEGVPEPEQKFELLVDLSIKNENGARTQKKCEVSFDCLCPSCAATVASLVDAIKRDFKKAGPVRKAKKKAEVGSAGKDEESPPTESKSSATPAPVPSSPEPRGVGVLQPSGLRVGDAGGVEAHASGKGAPASASRPTAK